MLLTGDLSEPSIKTFTGESQLKHVGVTIRTCLSFAAFVLAASFAGCMVKQEVNVVGSYDLVRPRGNDTYVLFDDHTYTRTFKPASTEPFQLERGSWELEILRRQCDVY